MTPFVRLHSSAPLTLRVTACLAARTHESACRACADACPVGVLTRREGAPVLGDGCLGCGRCGAACPTGALRVPGFAVSPPERETGVTLECWRVAPGDGMPGALRVPCLNGLTLGRLLALAAETDGRPVALLDRGFCPGCPTGGGDSQPAGGLIAAAQALLGALGVPPSRHPHLIVLPLPAGRMQADLAGFVLEERVSRRGFLTALTARTAAAVEPLAEAGPALARSAEPLRHRAVPEDRQRLLAALRRLAPGARLPARLFPDLQAGPGCADHRVCAAACPTGALVGYDSGDGADPDGGGARGIRFDPAHCVACGLCVALCPTRSLNLTDRGTATADPTCTADPAAPRALTRHRPRTCSQCGVGYAGDDPLCPACGRDQALARSLFGTLFGTQSGARSDIAGGL